MRYATWVMFIVALFTITGCVSRLTSEPAQESAEGVRYALPEPFLLVTPKADGTIDVDTLLLPNTERTYTVRQESFLATNTLNVELENQMLKSVDLTADTSKATGDAIQAYADLRKATIEAEAAQAKTTSDAAAAAKKRVSDAQLAVAKAQAVVNYLEPDKDKQAYVAEYIKAQIALQQAQAELAAAQTEARALGLDSFNTPTGGQFPEAYGPVLYRINQQRAADGKYTIKLVAVRFGDNTQAQFETSKLALATDPKPVKFELDPSEDFSKGDNSTLETSTTQPVTAIDPDKERFAIRKIGDNGDATLLKAKPDVVVFSGGRKLKISFPKNLEPGDYIVTMSLKVGSEDAFTSHDFKVKRR